MTTSQAVSVREGLPWLRSGPLWRVHQSEFSTLIDWLDKQKYTRVDLEGAVMTNRASAHAEIGRAFGSAYWHGKGWDAFNDCIYQFAREHENERIAVIWHHLDEAAAIAPATVAEVGWALLGVHGGAAPAPNGSLPYSMSVDIFAIGAAEDFDRSPQPAGSMSPSQSTKAV